MMTSDGMARRDSCYHGHSDDDDDNTMDASRSAADCKTNNEQWVRLSKNLLLQLVERICMLSFQQVESQNSSVPQFYRADELVKQPSKEQREDTPPSPAVPDSEPILAPSTPEVHPNHEISDDLGNQCTAVENNTATGIVSPKITCVASSSRKRRPLRMAAQNVKAGVDVIIEAKDHPVTRANDDGSEKAATKENSRSPPGVALITGSVVSKSCSFARRRHRLNAANSLRRHRQRSRRRCQLNRRHVGLSVEGQPPNDTDPHRGSLKRQKQSWLALNKSLVLCALERALNAEEARAASVTSSATSTRVAKSIWNPATSLTHHEAPALKSPDVTVQQQPPYRVGCPLFPMSLWRGADVISPVWIPSPNGLVSCPQSFDINRGLATSCTNSSLLCSLLGFDTGTAGDVTSPSAQPETDKTITKDLLCTSATGMTSSPTSPARVFSFNHNLSPSQNRPLTSSPSTLVPSLSSDDVIAPLDYRTVKQQQAPSSGRTVSLKPGCIGDKWVVLDKGDVSSLVESLVNTMIACGAPSERRRETQVISSVGSMNEPRKWKTNLMQRLRTEMQ